MLHKSIKNKNKGPLVIGRPTTPYLGSATDVDKNIKLFWHSIYIVKLYKIISKKLL